MVATTASMSESRIDAARRRASLAKAGIGVAAGVAFLAGIGLVRGTVSSHAKSRPQPLAAPKDFTRALRQANLGSGSIAPPQAPPQTSTGTS